MQLSLIKKPRKPYKHYTTFILYRWFAWKPVLADSGTRWVWLKWIGRYCVIMTRPGGRRVRQWYYIAEGK